MQLMWRLLLASLAVASAYVPTGRRLNAARVAPRGAARDTLTMMPLGIPKVAYKIPGAQSADWIDIYNRLYRERIIFLGQEIDDEIANQARGRESREGGARGRDLTSRFGCRSLA